MLLATDTKMGVLTLILCDINKLQKYKADLLKTNTNIKNILYKIPENSRFNKIKPKLKELC
jgi:hypothetical protein